MDVERLVAGLSKLPDLRLTTALNSVPRSDLAEFEEDFVPFWG